MPTVSLQQDWPPQIWDASSRQVQSQLVCVTATLPHNTQEENPSQGSWRNRDVKLNRAKQWCFQGWTVLFTQSQKSAIFCDICGDIKSHLTVNLLGKILKPSSCKSWSWMHSWNCSYKSHLQKGQRETEQDGIQRVPRKETQSWVCSYQTRWENNYLENTEGQ